MPILTLVYFCTDENTSISHTCSFHCDCLSNVESQSNGGISEQENIYFYVAGWQIGFGKTENYHPLMLIRQNEGRK